MNHAEIYCLKKSNNRKIRNVRMLLTGFFVTLTLELLLLFTVQLPKIKQFHDQSPVKIVKKNKK